MKLKNKIIKWLGGYTEDELIEQKKIEFCRTEKPVVPIKTHNIVKLESLECAKEYLAREIGHFIKEQGLIDYKLELDKNYESYDLYATVLVVKP